MISHKKKLLHVFILFLLLLSLNSNLYSYIYTKEAALIERDKFLLGAGIREYHTKGIGSIFEIPFVMHLGLSKRVEFIGIFPYLQLHRVRNAPETFGDILLFLKFDVKTFYFNYNKAISEEKILNQLDLIIGFNLATGPTKDVEKGFFSPYSIGLPDFRIGLLYSQYIGDLEITSDFIYTFASHLGEEYLPFKGTLWSSSKKTYLFGIVNVLVKFLWPGRYPWADKEAPKWEQYPHHDDFYNWNIGLKYSFEPDWLVFSYDVFTELNWVNTWSKLSVYPSFLLFTPGVRIFFHDTIYMTGGASILIDYHVYQYEKEIYFDNIYFIGINLLL